MTTDLLGNQLTQQEESLLAIHEQLKTLLGDPTLSPSTRSNALVALAAIGVAVTDLALVYEHLTDFTA